MSAGDETLLFATINFERKHLRFLGHLIWPSF